MTSNRRRKEQERHRCNKIVHLSPETLHNYIIFDLVRTVN